MEDIWISPVLILQRKLAHHSKIMRNKPDDIWGPLVRQNMGDGDGGGGRS
jgi:hypothetical protein